MPPISIEDRLRALHAHYTSRVNAAIADDRMDLVGDLAHAYEDEALELMLALEESAPRRRNRSPIEYLDLDGWEMTTEIRSAGHGWRWIFRRHNR